MPPGSVGALLPAPSRLNTLSSPPCSESVGIHNARPAAVRCRSSAAIAASAPRELGRDPERLTHQEPSQHHVAPQDHRDQ